MSALRRTAVMLAALMIAVAAGCAGRENSPPTADTAPDGANPAAETPADDAPSSAPVQAVEDSDAISPSAVRAPLPRPRTDGVAALLNGRVWLAGGRGDGRLAEVDVFDPETGRWHEGPLLPTPRTGAAVAADGRRMFVLGGESEAGVSDTVEVLDADAGVWFQSTSVPTPRRHAAAAFVDGRIWVIGGFNADLGMDVDTVEIYDVEADAWLAGPPLPDPAQGAAAIVVNGRLHVFGGSGDGRAHLVLSGDRWDERRRIPFEKIHARAAAFEGLVILVGGEPGTRECHVYDAASDLWSLGAVRGEATFRAATALAGNRLYAFGGAASPRPEARGTAAFEFLDLDQRIWAYLHAAPATR